MELPGLNVQLDDIPPEGLDIPLAEAPEPFRAVMRDLSEDRSLPVLEGHVRLQRVEGSTTVLVSGFVGARLLRSCDRCLEPVWVSVGDSLDVVAQSRAEAFADGEEEVELDEESLDVTFFEPAAGLSVEELVREQLLLSMPTSVLCKEECLGICQQCGADLNRETCRCEVETIDPRLAVLATLKRTR